MAGWTFNRTTPSARSGGKPRHISEIGIQCHEHAAVLDGELQDVFVGRSGKANLKHRGSIVPLGSQLRGMLWREDSHPEKASLGCEDNLISGETGRIFQASLKVLGPELRICSQNDLAGLTGSEFLEDQIDGNPGSFETRLPHHHICPSLDEFRKLHHLNSIREFAPSSPWTNLRLSCAEGRISTFCS